MIILRKNYTNKRLVVEDNNGTKISKFECI